MNLLILLNAASAQEEAFDAHGLTIVAEDGDLRDGLVTWRAENLNGKRGSVGLLVEYADENLVEYVEDINGITETPLLDDLLMGHVRGTLAFSDRIGLGLVLPVVIASDGATGAGGFGLADTRISVPVGLVLPDSDGTGLGLSVIPYADLPIGDEERFLGDAGFSGGGMVAASMGLSRLQLNSNVGIDASPGTTLDSWTGGAGLIAGAGLSALVTDGFALGAEAQARPLLQSSSVSGTHFPAEAVLSGRGRTEGGLTWNLGAALPLSAGATAARFRTFAGIGMSFGAEAPATLNIQVVDGDGKPLPGATVQTDQGTLTTDASGGVLFDDGRAGSQVSVQGSLSGYEPDTESLTLARGDNTAQLTLNALPASIALTVRTQEGTPLDATVTLQGPASMDPISVGADGEEQLGLRHGSWTLGFSLDGYDPVSRSVSLSPGEETDLAVVMRPPAVATEPVTEPITEPVVVGDFDLPTVYFAYNSFSLSSSAKRELRALAKDLNSNPGTQLIIYGHTDVRGNETFNEGLGQLRANAVLNYMSDQGVDYKRLTARTMGENEVSNRGSSESAHAENRRVTFAFKR